MESDPKTGEAILTNHMGSSMNTDLAALLELQAKHEVVLDIEEELRALEPQVGDLDAELERAQQNFEAHRTRAEEAEQRRVELEGKIESYRVMQDRKRQKLEWVRGAKEAATLMAELDLARGVLAREEAEWIRSADKVKETERIATESEEGVREIQEAQAEKREELGGERSDFESKLSQAKSERDTAGKNVKQNLRDQFNRILRGRARLALYPLTAGACGHCFTQVPLHRAQKIRNGDSIEACEACGVLVYEDDSPEPTPAAAEEKS